MEEIPKLHGWITPEYALEMARELYKFLIDNGYQWTDIVQPDYHCIEKGWKIGSFKG